MNLFRLLASVVLASGMFVAAAAPAAAGHITTVPSSLSPGEQYRLLFLTSARRNALSSNIADYNAFVTAAANTNPELVALGTSWNAVASTSTIDARDNTRTAPTDVSVAIFLLDDRRFAADSAALWSGNVDVRPQVRENGTFRTNSVWTGTQVGGFKAGQFALGVGGATMWGGSDRLDVTWVQAGINFPAPTQLPMYAISGLLTKAPATVPEPSTFILLSIGAVCLVVGRLHRHKRANKLS